MTQTPANDPANPTRTPSGTPVESLPEHIAARSGMPRDGAEQGPHDTAGRAAALGQEANAQLLHGDARESAERTAEGARDAARGLRDQAAERVADIKDRAADQAASLKERAGEAYDEVRDRAGAAYDDARTWAGGHYERQRRRASDLAEHGSRRLHEGRTATEAFVSENPLLVGVVGLAAGLLLGALLPRTRQEDQALGPYADDLRDQGIRYAREMTHRGRAFVETALDPDNLDAAVRRANAPSPDYEGPERTAHRL